MRGKTVDVSYVSNFITNCVQNGTKDQKDIISEARLKIASIDKTLGEIESIKAERSKLMDVVVALDTSIPENDSTPQFVMNDSLKSDVSLSICSVLESGSTPSMPELLKLVSNAQKTDVYSSVKDLCEMGIILRSGDHFECGPNWEMYLNIDFS